MAKIYRVKANVWLTVTANSAAEAADQAEDRMETAKDYFDEYEINHEPDLIGDGNGWDD
jgi:hypothetical protein